MTVFVLGLALSLAAPARAFDAAGAVRGVALSLGSRRRVVARLTFDRRKAASGGFVFAAARLTNADEPAIRLSAAVVTADEGALSAAGRLARRHGVPALSLRGAGWEPGALLVPRPVLGPPRAAGASQVMLVERVEARRLSEGDVVAVDPAGALIPLEAGEQAFELELASALRAFEGLRDLQALLQWYDARAEAGGRPSPFPVRNRTKGWPAKASQESCPSTRPQSGQVVAPSSLAPHAGQSAEKA